MTTKKAPPSVKAGMSLRHVLCLWWKLVILVSVAICVLAFLRIQQYHAEDNSGDDASYSTALPRKSRFLVGGANHFTGDPKVAFLFLVRRNLPLDFLWESFLENVDKASFSIYIHSEPGFVFDESTTRSAFFYNRQLKKSIKVTWGESSMIQAERLLFEEALRDPANQRFVLLSDSCVPLYNFSYIYKYLMDSPRSFVDSFLDKKDMRYNSMMSPVVPKKKWRKGSQWVTLIRRHAEVVVDDDIVFPIFRKFCKRRPPFDLSKGKKKSIIPKHDCIPDEHYVQTLLAIIPKHDCIPDEHYVQTLLAIIPKHDCIPDEHYVQTLLAMNDLETELERRTLTYTSWKQSKSNTENEAWHPFTFSYADSGPQQIKRIKDINHVYYETEFRTEWCSNNSTSVPCFLFARKFSQGAAMRLLSQGVVGNFDISALMPPP